MSCDPDEVITADDLTGLKQDIATIDDVVESSLDTTITKNGKVINTLLGQLKLLGFQPPIPYVASIVFGTSDNTKTVEEAGVVYAPLPSALPFTTSGTFIGDDDARFFVVQGLTPGDLADLTVIVYDSVPQMKSNSDVNGTTIETAAYFSGFAGTPDGPIGGAKYFVTSKANHDIMRGTSTVSETGDHTLLSGDVAMIINQQVRVSQFGAVGTGDETDIFDSMLKTFPNGGDFLIDVLVNVTKASLAALPLSGLTVPANSKIEWLEGKFTTCEASVDLPHIFTGQGSSNSNVDYINPQIDGNNSTLNGIGGNNSTISRLNNVWVKGGDFKNIKHSFDTTGVGGGRGVTFQFGVSNCGVVGGTRFFNVYEPCDVAGNDLTETHGTKDAHGIIFADYVCEECDVLGGSFNLETQDSIPDMITAAIFSNISFRNCGASDSSWPGLSFVRVNNAGNSSVWGDVFKPATSFNGNWEAEAFSGGDAEWDESLASYSIGARVKVTNDGQLSALFAFQGDAGILVDGVTGTNEPAYPTIGAIVSGTFGGVKTDNINIKVECVAGMNAGPTPAVYPINFRNFDKVVQSDISYRNIGLTVFVVSGTLPVNVGNEYQQEGLKVRAVIDKALLSGGILNDRLGNANGGFRNSVVVEDVQRAVGVSGNFDFVFECQNTLPAGGFSGNFNHVTTHPQHIKVFETSDQLKLERIGSSAGSARFFASSGKVSMDGELILQLAEDGSGLQLRDTNSVLYTIDVDTSGRLLINGTVVGTQS